MPPPRVRRQANTELQKNNGALSTTYAVCSKLDSYTFNFVSLFSLTTTVFLFISYICVLVTQLIHFTFLFLSFFSRNQCVPELEIRAVYPRNTEVAGHSSRSHGACTDRASGSHRACAACLDARDAPLHSAGALCHSSGRWTAVGSCLSSPAPAQGATPVFGC